MSGGERVGLPSRSRTRSYGSLVTSPRSPLPHRRVLHTLLPGETLQGLALKYGVTMEQIKRANRLYTNESIFLKKSLSIPVMADVNPVSDDEEEGGVANPGAGHLHDDGRDIAELSPNDFLRRLDGLIDQSKHAAAQRCRDAEKRISALEAACSSHNPLRRSLTVTFPPHHGSVPHTVTKLTMKLRESEDEIFQL